jgi:sphingolipid 4-desaturase/C4-monooxygenase
MLVLANSVADAAAGRPEKRISDHARHHRDESRRVLEAHPEIRDLFGPKWVTALAIPVLLALHWSMAWLVSGGGILTVFVAAFFFGQLVLHAAGALLHETAHQLVFRRGKAKLIFDLGLELILASFGKQLRYQHEHISSHHPHQGQYEWDYEHEDICGYMARRELRAHHPHYQRALTIATMALHILPFGFLIADQIIPPVYGRLTGRKVKDERRDIGASKPTRAEVAMFVAVSLFSNAVLFFGFGFWAWLYHNWALSLFLSKWGISNLGQSLSEHPDGDDLRPTRSTYGWINWFLFNTGYHHEHHTFPNVAWMHLPRIKATAPHVFDAASERTYAGLWWRHVRADFSPSRWNPDLQAQRIARCESVVADRPQR